MTIVFTWPEAAIEAMRAHAANGLSASQIAAALSPVFDYPLTRNSIVGKCARVGIKLAWQPPNKTAGEKIAKARVSAPKPRVEAFVDFLGTPEREQPVVVDLPVTGRVSLMELRHRHCRFPTNQNEDGEWLFCGEDKSGEKPYCAKHCALSYVKPTSIRIRPSW